MDQERQWVQLQQPQRGAQYFQTTQTYAVQLTFGIWFSNFNSKQEEFLKKVLIDKSQPHMKQNRQN